MKTIKDKLQLALEALITINNAIYVNSQQEAAAVYKANDAITALKEALTSVPDWASEAKEQPAQQEPVGCEGAIVNGRVYADRLEHDYKFECEAGPLHLCADWVEFRRCFDWLAQHTSPPAQRKPCQVWDAEGYDALCQELEGWKARAQRKPLTVDQVWQNDQLMSLNAELGCSMDLLVEVVRAIEAAHGIKENT